MIKVGDRFSLNNENWEVIFIDNESVAIARSENGEGRVVSQCTIYKNWYEQQKQRADELQDDNEVLNNTISNLLVQITEYANRMGSADKKWNELKDNNQNLFNA